MSNDLDVSYHMEKMMRPSEQLAKLASLYEERNKQYGNSYKEAGAVLTALFPNGVKLHSHSDMDRFCIIVHMITKLMRYSNNFYTPENPDHLKDISVYATMLLELDGERE
jgi:hypothetical protein